MCHVDERDLDALHIQIITRSNFWDISFITDVFIDDDRFKIDIRDSMILFSSYRLDRMAFFLED